MGVVIQPLYRQHEVPHPVHPRQCRHGLPQVCPRGYPRGAIRTRGDRCRTIRAYRARDLSPRPWYCQTWCSAASCCSSAVPTAPALPAAPTVPAATAVLPAASSACWIRQWTLAGTVLQQQGGGSGVQEEVLKRGAREREGRVLYIVISIGPRQQSYAVCNVGCPRLYDYKL